MANDYSRESAAALRLRMQGHWAVVGEELRGSGEALRNELRPINLIRKHPFVSAAVAGSAGLLLARFLIRRKRSPAVISAHEPSPTIRDRLRNGLASGALSLGGRLISTLVVGAVSKAVLRSGAGK
jgi:hypothetical protein